MASQKGYFFEPNKEGVGRATQVDRQPLQAKKSKHWGRETQRMILMLMKGCGRGRGKQGLRRV